MRKSEKVHLELIAKVQATDDGYLSAGEVDELEECFKSRTNGTWRCIGCKGSEKELSSDSQVSGLSIWNEGNVIS